MMIEALFILVIAAIGAIAYAWERESERVDWMTRYLEGDWK